MRLISAIIMWVVLIILAVIESILSGSFYCTGQYCGGSTFRFERLVGPIFWVSILSLIIFGFSKFKAIPNFLERIDSLKKLKFIFWASFFPWVIFTLMLLLAINDKSEWGAIGLFFMGVLLFIISGIIVSIPGLIISIGELKNRRSTWAIITAGICAINIIVIVLGYFFVI